MVAGGRYELYSNHALEIQAVAAATLPAAEIEAVGTAVTQLLV
jgi:hypothetical protein